MTVLSTEYPVRVFQQFATIDLISQGRAELTAGRGSFIESYPLSGARLEDYDALYEEKRGLLLKLKGQERVTWNGRFRSSLDDAIVPHRPFVGSPEQVAEKIVKMHGHMQQDRQIFPLDLSSVPQRTVLEAIELLGTEVLPLVQRELGTAVGAAPGILSQPGP